MKLTNWKTTVAGALMALGTTLSTSEDATLKLIGQILTPLGALIMGLAAKDWNVTGGTKTQ